MRLPGSHLSHLHLPWGHCMVQVTTADPREDLLCIRCHIGLCSHYLTCITEEGRIPAPILQMRRLRAQETEAAGCAPGVSAPGSQVLADSGGSDYGALLLQTLTYNSAGAVVGFLSKIKVPSGGSWALWGPLASADSSLHSHQCSEPSPAPVLDQTSEALSYLTEPRAPASPSFPNRKQTC